MTKTEKKKNRPTKLKQKDHSKKHTLRNWLLGVAIGIVVLVLSIFISFQVSPWPGSMLIRYFFTKGGAQTAAAFEKHIPAGITSVDDQQYRLNDKDGYLDVFYPDGTAAPLPTIVWVHGGGWVSGDKDGVDGYLKILASYGYTTVGVDYSIAPEKKYPVPLHQVNDALSYIQENAERLHIDKDRIVLAGDSAGSQIVAQVGNFITSSTYAEELKISPALLASQLKGMVLNCGAYDLDLPDYKDGIQGWFLRTVLWAYSGKKNFMNDADLRHASVVDYVTPQFPPSFITAGNVDPLEQQSKVFAEKLTSIGVRVDSLFYPDDYQPELNHEYQFNLDTDDGQKALTRITDFLKTVL